MANNSHSNANVGNADGKDVASDNDASITQTTTTNNNTPNNNNNLRRRTKSDNITSAANVDEFEQGISKEPVSILFDAPSTVTKRDVWQIDLIQILDILVSIIERSGKKDLRVAGMAALSSSLIYRLKVESISALHKAAMAPKNSPIRRQDVDIEMIGIPYRHEPTYPVTFDDLLGLLQDLIGTMANPKTRGRSRKPLIQDLAQPPVFENYLLSLETVIGQYRDMIMRKIEDVGHGILQDITENLDALDSVRCFFAALFLARDGVVDLEQVGDDIRIILIPQIGDDDGDNNNNDDKNNDDGKNNDHGNVDDVSFDTGRVLSGGTH